jgi:hypothetical protein
MIDEDQFKREDTWLQPICSVFKKKGPGGEDFLYLLDTMLQEKNIPFMKFLENASNGVGCTVHEGLYYSLDQNWEDPALFDEVTFFVGSYESYSLSIPDYLELLKITTDTYISNVPADANLALMYLAATEERYAGKQ